MSTSLTSGTRLGHYEIISVIGAGGMGVVYRARDAQLERTIALKVLAERPDLADNSERLLQEARAASALSHPGICAVHEVRQEDGHVFIVMEFVDGRPLSEHIPLTGLPADSFLRYSVQIADALAHAHSHGVLHRDLKSANIILTKDGRTKIVDFGLARRFARPNEQAETRALAADAETVSGTLAYLAPEVLQGHLQSVSSDVWSFGVLLYEMAAGHLPFSGRTLFEQTAAILRAPAPPLPSHVSAGVRTIIGHCLVKEPAQRYETVREVLAALETVQSDTSIASVAPRSLAPSRSSRRAVIGWTTAAAIAALAGLAIWRVGLNRAPANGAGRLVQLFSSDREAYDPALSADGTMIAYAAEDAGRTDLFVSRVAGGGRLRLTSDDQREAHPRFSPNGELVLFTRRALDGSAPEICVVPTFGGQVSVILSRGAYPTWSPDGKRIVFTRMTAGGAQLLASAGADGSDIRDILAESDASPFTRNPAWSPDGRLIAFVQGSGGVSGEIWVANAEGPSVPRRVSTDPAAVFSDEPVFSTDGRAIIHVSNRGGATNIWALPVAGGRATRLTNGPGPDETPTVDASGRVAFLSSRWRNQLILHDLATSESRVLFRYTPFIWAPAFSPSGRDVVFSRGELDGSWHLWMTDIDNTPPRELTHTEQGELYPRWTPDGQSVLFHNWAAPRRIWRVSRDGGPAVALTPVDQDAAYGDLSPDGGSLVYAVTEPNGERVYVLPLAGGARPRLLRAEPASVPRWSPDGAWIAFSPNRGNSAGVFVMRPDGTNQRRLTQTGGWPVWWPDGRRLGYLRFVNANQQIETIEFDGSSAATRIPIDFVGSNYPFDVSRSGDLLATSSAVHVSSEIWVLDPRQ